MIQFNLLPDVKIEYLQAQQKKQVITLVSVLVTSVSVAIFMILLLSVKVVQQKSISDLSKDITIQSQTLKSNTNLSKILTIQNQLTQLTSLHEKKAAAGRLFTYIGQVTPSNVTISNLELDLATSKVVLTGSAPSLDAINTYVDTLKFTKYTIDDAVATERAFKGVVVSSFTRETGVTRYTITTNIEPILFENTKSTKLTVPSIVTTRSTTERPSALFKGEK